jgi:hypothetical protein
LKLLDELRPESSHVVAVHREIELKFGFPSRR